MNRLVILLLLISFGQLAKTQNLSDLSFGTDTTLEVVSWNLKQFPKAGQRTMDTVQNILEALDVDIIALQEIDDTSKCRQMLNNMPDYGLLVGDPNEFEGLAYIYKKSTITVKNLYHIFTSWSAGYNFPRAPLVVEIEYRGREFVLINNHLKCCGDGYLDLNDGTDEETRRYRAVNELKNYMDNFLSTKRTIMLGDLNDEIQEPLAQNVFQRFITDSLNYKFADRVLALGPAQDWSFPSWPSHLDHILVNQALFYAFQQPETELRCFSIDEYLPGGMPEYEQKVSDHRPVALKLWIKPVLGLGQENIIEGLGSSLHLFPNPVQAQLHLRFSNLSLQKYEIFNAVGQMHATSSVDPSKRKMSIELSQLPKGFYFIHLYTSNYRRLTRSFFKQ